MKNVGESEVGVSGGRVAIERFTWEGNRKYLKSAALDAWLNQHVGDFDIVHLHSVWQFPTFSAARACWKIGKPYVVLLNGMLDHYAVNQHSKWLKRLYWAWREKDVEERSKGIHFLNQAEIRRAIPWMGGMAKFVIGNGIGKGELEKLPKRGAFRAAYPEIGDRPLALFLSRVHPKKGLERLIPAWKGLAAKRPEVKLAIAGTGEASYLAKIDRLIAEYGLTGKVIRVGQLVGGKKWEAMVDADVFALPSHQEGFSMAITESLAAGLPAVVTEECNFDELVGENGTCGVIVRNGEMGAFTEEVMRLMDDPDRRKQMGEIGSKLIRERYTWDRIAGDLEKVYQWILAGKALNVDGADVWR